MKFLPKTLLGKWSVGLIISFSLALAVFYLLVASGQRGGQTFFSNPLLAFPFLLAASSGIASFFTGILSIAKDKERSILVFLSSLIGLIVLAFVLGETLLPH